MGIIFGMIPLAVIAVVIILIIGLVNKKESKEFNTFIRNIYIYLILITFLGVLVVSVIVTFNYGLEVLFPDSETNSYYYNSHNSNLNDCIAGLISSILSGVIFVYYSRLANKYKSSKKEIIKDRIEE